MKTLKRVPVQLVRVCYGLDEVCSADQFRPMVALLKMAGNGHCLTACNHADKL